MSDHASMITLLQFSGMQDAFKRRNSKTMDQFTDRRGSISVYDTYSLPNSKADMRRFSSYEQLAPFFQQILSQESNNTKPVTPAPAPVPASPSTDSSSSAPSPLVKSSRRGSISRFTSALTGSFRRQRSVTSITATSESESEVSCDDLDAQIAKIKGQLAQFKSEDIDMSQRVEDLSSSVEDLCMHNPTMPECYSPLSTQDNLYYRLRQEKMQMQRSQSFQSYRACASSCGLQSISESVNESSDSELDEEEDDQQTFKTSRDICLRRSPPLQRSRPSSFASISEEPEPSTTDGDNYIDDKANTKDYCLLNNTFRPQALAKAKSMSQLPDVIVNDLTRRDSAADSSKRLSLISIMSDSFLVTQRHLPALHSLSREYEF